eukprot:gene2545-3149_t
MIKECSDCTGFSLREVNTANSQETKIDLIRPDSKLVNPGLIYHQLKGSQDDQVIASGLIAKNESTGDIEFHPSGLYRLLPLESSAPMKFFKVVPTDKSPNTFNVQELNTDKITKDISKFTEDYSATVPFIQSNWVHMKITSGESVLTGSIQGGQLKITRVFIRLPDPSMCPKILVAVNCEKNMIATYERNPRRCEVFSGCVKPGGCPQMVPHCSEGYQLEKIPSKSKNGCPAFYCDPDFL